VYQLEGSISLARIDANLLQVLTSDRHLMVGNGGFSFTLNRVERAEPRLSAAAARSEPDMSYQISALAKGPNVFGVFEGRSPCLGIARQLKITVHPACSRAKWRVTLYQDAETRAPTTYKVEGTLHLDGPREGTWTLVQGTRSDPHAMVYQLAPTASASAMLLMKGDDNVLFMLEENGAPLVGHGDFSYTLNRHDAV
jgi:hypothetical protein